jgi:hypothetical protein
MTSEPKKNKKLFFLVALPRSGNTLFASIINQNPNIVCTANSITLEIMKDLFLLKETDVFLNYPDHRSLDNVLDSVYDNYYKDWPQEYIIDRGPVLAKGNFELIKKHFKRPFKCIVLLRDLMDVLASFMKWYTENPDAFPNRFNLKNDDEKLSTFMSKEGGIAKELEAIKNAYNYPEICHFVKYDDLVAKPQEEIQKIYKFLEIPFFNHQFKDLKQININGMGYDDRIVGQDMHTIRSVIRKKYNPYIERIPERIKQKYGHIKF